MLDTEPVRGATTPGRRAEPVRRRATFQIKSMVDAVLAGYRDAMASGAPSRAIHAGVRLRPRPENRLVAASWPTRRARLKDRRPRCPPPPANDAANRSQTHCARWRPSRSSPPIRRSSWPVWSAPANGLAARAGRRDPLSPLRRRRHRLRSRYFIAITPSIGVRAIARFHSLRVYTPRAFRHPLQPRSRLAGGWTFPLLVVFAALFFLKAGGVVSRVWVAAWFVFGFALLVRSNARCLPDDFAALARPDGLQRRAVGGRRRRVRPRRCFASLEERPDPTELRLLGVFDDRSDERSPRLVEGIP